MLRTRSNKANVFPLVVMVLISFTVLFSFSACRTRVKRMDTDKVKDLSGRWNDTDSRLVSEEMIKDFLADPRVERFSAESGKIPDVIVGRVLNKSQEHINTETFVKDLERALIRSDKVNFVASKGERIGVREEREDMQTHAETSTRKSPYREAGADLMVMGQMNTIFDEERTWFFKRSVAFYQVELEAVNMKNNRKVWIGQKKIKKYIRRPKAKL